MITIYFKVMNDTFQNQEFNLRFASYFTSVVLKTCMVVPVLMKQIEKNTLKDFFESLLKAMLKEDLSKEVDE